MNQDSRRVSSAHVGALVFALLGLGVAAPSACGVIVSTPIGQARGTHARPGATEGPWARCRFETDTPDRNDAPTVCPDPNATPEGPWTCVPATESRTFDGTPYIYCQAFAVCNYACVEAADCPAPGSGTAALVCMGGACQLSCHADAECPEGMICIDGGEGLGPGRCMWVYADYCADVSTSPADPCGGKATCEACQLCDDCDEGGFCNPDGDCQYGDPSLCGSG